MLRRTGTEPGGEMLQYHICDVFTDRPFSGTPLAVVEGADDLTAAQMQTIARQFNLSETIFVMAPRDPAHRADVRIFLPRAEIPFAGHPTIGCALHLAGGTDGAMVLGTQAGPVPVSVTGGVAEFTAPVLPRAGAELPADLVAAAIGLAPGEIGFDRHRPGMAMAASAFVFAPIASPDALARATPAGAGWGRLVAAGSPLVYLYARDGAGFRARMFAPTEGVPEDPATGAAAACLPARLLAAGDLGEGETRLALRQGIEMGRPSEIGLTAVTRHGKLSEIRISGRAAPVAQGRIRIPEAS